MTRLAVSGPPGPCHFVLAFDCVFCCMKSFMPFCTPWFDLLRFFGKGCIRWCIATSARDAEGQKSDR